MWINPFDRHRSERRPVVKSDHIEPIVRHPMGRHFAATKQQSSGSGE